MKKVIFVALTFIVSMSLSAQSNSISNGGFETGALIKGTKNCVVGDDWYYLINKGRIPNGNI